MSPAPAYVRTLADDAHRLGTRESMWGMAKNASARYTCTCAGAGVACGGTIDLAVEVDDKAHAFLVAERLTVKITH
jgi:hypothetical protein